VLLHVSPKDQNVIQKDNTGSPLADQPLLSGYACCWTGEWFPVLMECVTSSVVPNSLELRENISA
jgi:hypothetical protein